MILIIQGETATAACCVVAQPTTCAHVKGHDAYVITTANSLQMSTFTASQSCERKLGLCCCHWPSHLAAMSSPWRGAVACPPACSPRHPPHTQPLPRTNAKLALTPPRLVQRGLLQQALLGAAAHSASPAAVNSLGSDRACRFTGADSGSIPRKYGVSAAARGGNTSCSATCAVCTPTSSQSAGDCCCCCCCWVPPQTWPARPALPPTS
jgi:hypothetical protein